MKLKYTFILSLLAIMGFWNVNAQVVKFPVVKNKIVVIAHRGNHVKVPENTIASTKEAVRVGADYVEVDLRTTKDGYLVALHDQTVDRTTNGVGKISELNWSEVKKLKAFNDNKNTHRIPKFDAVLEACQGEINIYLDFKDGDVVETWRQIKAAGMENQVIVYLNKPEQYVAWRKVAPQVPLMSSLPDKIKSTEQFEEFLKEYPFDIFDNIRDLGLVKAAHSLKIQIWLDVQSKDENATKWQAALTTGCDGLQTDHPESLVKFINQ